MDNRFVAIGVRTAAERLGGTLGDFLIAAAELLEVRKNRDCKPCAKSYLQYTKELEEAWVKLREAAERIGI